MAGLTYSPEEIAVYIPLIVGLAPGLVYWLIITARRSKK